MMTSEMTSLIDKDRNAHTVYIYFIGQTCTGDNVVILDRSLPIHYGNMARVNQRVDIMRAAGKQVFLLKNIRLKGALH